MRENQLSDSIRLAWIYGALQRRDWAGAGAQCKALLQVNPSCASAHHALGLSLCGAADYERALAHVAQAVELDSRCPTWAHDLGIVYAKLKRWSEAEHVLAPWLHTFDSKTVALYLSIAVNASRAAEAVCNVRELNHAALEKNPEFLCEYGRALHAASRKREAEVVLRKCLAAHPTVARAHDIIAGLYHDTNEGDRAFEHWRTLARLQPNSGYAQLRLAVAFSFRGRLDESRAARRDALRLGLVTPQDRSTVVRLMLFDPLENAQTILSGCRDACRSLELGHRPSTSRPRHEREGRLRIGYLSAEFHQSPAFYFLSPFLEHHERADFEVFLYNNSRTSDPCTFAYRKMSEHWRDVALRSDDAVLRMMETDGLDVLVDLSGHFPANRLSVFARRAAAVQATFPNYPSTTGCPEVDYFFTDQWTSPFGCEDEYSERLYRLSSGYLMYAPPPDAPAIPQLPALRNSCVTFGLIQQFSKVSSDVWDTVAEVLRQLPASKLLLHNGDEELDRSDSVTMQFVKLQFVTRDIDPARVRFAGPLPHRRHLELLGEIDIALDAWPYGGQTTTCECLWMGVPVVTMTGKTHVSRVSAGLLHRVGLAQLVTSSPASYIQVATRLAQEIDALTHVRHSLRDQVSEALVNGAELAGQMEEAYRDWSA